MRLALIDFQRKMDADLERIEASINLFLNQAEKLLAEKNQISSGEVRLKIAEACKRGLQDFGLMRDRLLVRRQLIEGIPLN